MSDPENPWRLLVSARRFEGDFFVVNDDRVLDPAGRETRYGVIKFKNRGLRILPIDAEGHTFLVGQWRYGAGYYSWELPAGNQNSGETPQEGAARELREEIGYAAEHWANLLEVVPSGSITDQRERSFMAWGLSEAPLDRDEQERIDVRRVPFSQVVAMAVAGEIKDAGTIIAILGTHMRAATGALSDEHARLLQGA